jgi:hypothetical protein
MCLHGYPRRRLATGFLGVLGRDSWGPTELARGSLESPSPSELGSRRSKGDRGRKGCAAEFT